MNPPIQRKSVFRRLIRDAICGLERRSGPDGVLQPLVQSVCFRLLRFDEWVRRLEGTCGQKAAARRAGGDKRPSSGRVARPQNPRI
jgi:hypothetical protein